MASCLVNLHLLINCQYCFKSDFPQKKIRRGWLPQASTPHSYMAEELGLVNPKSNLTVLLPRSFPDICRAAKTESPDRHGPAEIKQSDLRSAFHFSSGTVNSMTFSWSISCHIFLHFCGFCGFCCLKWPPSQHCEQEGTYIQYSALILNVLFDNFAILTYPITIVQINTNW